MALVDNLVSYYNFERNSNDSKGANDGVSVAVSWKRVLSNFSASFDGDVSEITITSDASLQITGDLTIAFQIRPTDVGSEQNIVYKDPDSEYAIILQTNGDIVFSHGNGTTAETFNLLDVSTYLTNNEKAHIVLVRDSATNSIFSYKNGQQILSTTYSATVATSTDDLVLGGLNPNRFSGELDELGIWNRPITSTEVTELYSDGKILVYDSTSDSFVASSGYKHYSLLTENGDAGDFWSNLSATNRERYLNTEDTLTAGGLTGEYYDAIDFTNLTLTRVDSTIDFLWPAGASPDPSIDDDRFSIRWTGYLRPDFTETYTLYIGSDDGTRLYIDGVLLIDNWGNHAYIQESGTIALEANKFYHVEIEYYENTGGAEVDFYWESVSQAYEVVPSTALYYTVGSATYNVYSSIAQWEIDRARDLVSLNEKEILDIRGQWSSSTPEVNLTGWTTDIEDDYYVVIQALELSRPPNVYSSPSLPAHFRIVSTQATVPAIAISNFSLELKNIQAESQDDVIQVNTNAGDKVRILYSQIRNTDQSSAGVIADQNAGTLEIASTVVLNAANGILASVNNTGTVYIVDSTVTTCINGIKSNNTVVRPTSSAVFNNTDDFVDSFPTNWPRYCASDDNDVGIQSIDISPGGTESTDWDNAFADYLNGDFRIASDTSVLYDAGEPNVGGNYYTFNDIPYLDVGNAPRIRRDVGAFSFTNWWDYRFIERIQITVPASLVPTDLTDFTLYIDLEKTNPFSGIWTRSDSAGLDLRVASATTRERIPQELVFFDRPGKDGEIWGKGELSGTDDTTFYVYYNFVNFPEEPDAPDSPPDNNINGQFEVWSDYQAVWHLQSLDILDSTSNGYDGTVRGTPSVVTDGRFGYSIEWNETGAANQESADVGNISTDATWTALTVESWFRKDSTGDERMICKAESGTAPGGHIFALHSQTGFQAISTRVGTDINDAFTFDGNTEFTTGEWSFAATNWSATDGELRLFLNGQADGTASQPGNHIRTSNQQVEIANNDNSTLNRFWEGGLDEIRVAKVRFPNYQERLEAQYNNQTSEAFSEPAPQPETNPVFPPIQDVVPEGTWVGTATGATTLSIDVDIPTLTGKLALLIGVSNEDNNVSQVSSITLNTVNPTFAGRDIQGTGFSNTSEIWYYLNDDLPTTPGTYTVTITMSETTTGIGATIALYDVILQEAPVYSGNNAAGSTTITTNATIDLDFVESNLAFEVASAGDSETSTISDNQTQITDVEIGISAARHASSFGVYTESGIEAITRTYAASVNRLAQSVLVLKSGEEKNYTYQPFGGMTLSGVVDGTWTLEILFEGVDGATLTGVAGFELDVSYTATGSIILSGEVTGTIDLEYEAIATAITLGGEADTFPELAREGTGGLAFNEVDDLTDYFPEFIREGTGGLTFAGTVPEFDTVELIFIPIGSAFHIGGSDYFVEFTREGTGGIIFNGAVNEADTIDITFEVITEAIILTGSPDYFVEFIREGTGGLAFNEVDDLTEYFPEFVREGTGGLAFNEADDTSERTIEFVREGTGGLAFNEADDTSERTIEFVREATGSASFNGAAEYQGTLTINFFPSGAAITIGQVDADLIIVIFAPTEGGATLSGAAGDRVADITATIEDGGKVETFSGFAQADYEPVYIYEPKLTSPYNLRFLGSAPFFIPPSQFSYETSGLIRLGGSAEVEFFANKSYTGTGGARFRRTHRLVKYSYSADFIYANVTGGIVLSGEALRGQFVIFAQEPTGGIVVSDAGDIVADEIIWTWAYIGTGGLKTYETATKAIYSKNLSYTPLTSKPIRVDGAAALVFISSEYVYEGGGQVELNPSRQHEYVASGQLVFTPIATTVGSGVELSKDFKYTGSGRLSIDYPPTGSQADYDPEYVYDAFGVLRFRGDTSIVASIDFTNYDPSGSLVFNEATGEADYEVMLSYTATGGLVFTTPVTVEREVNYINIDSGGQLLLSGSAELEPQFSYVAISGAGGQLLINGASQIVFQEYEAEAGGSSRLILSGDVVADEIVVEFRYVASGSARFTRSVFVQRTLGYIYITKTKRMRLTGSAAIEAADYIYPNYDGVPAPTTISGSAITTYEVINPYDAVATTINLAGIALAEYDSLYEYEPIGSISTAGTVVADEQVLDYIYQAAGQIFGVGNADTVGQNFHEYEATGSLQTYGLTQVNYRFVIARLTNTTEAPRSLREAFASTTFTFETNR